MKTRIRIIAVIFTITLFSRCKKETVINGNVKDVFTGAPIKNIEVRLRDKKTTLFKTEVNIIETTYTDSDGNFHFENNSKKVYDLLVIHGISLSEGASYESIEGTDGYYSVNKSKVQNVNLTWIQKAVINIKLKNNTPFDSNDSFEFYYRYAGSIKENKFIGTTINKDFTLDAIANKVSSIDYKVIKNGIETTNTATIIATPDSPNILEINY